MRGGESARWVEELRAVSQHAHRDALGASGLDQLLADIDRLAAQERDLDREALLRDIGDRLADALGFLLAVDVLPLDRLGRALARDVDDLGDREGWFRR